MEFNTRPDLIAINEGKAELASLGPSAEEEASFLAKGITGALGVGVVAQVMLLVLAVDSCQVTGYLVLVSRFIQSGNECHPISEDSVREAACPILVLGALLFEYI